MTFVARTYEQILNDMIAFMQSRTSISDYNPGSVIRTILEAAALEDDEQYFQMVQLLDMFSLTTAAGDDLDRRLADFGITRRGATNSTGRGQFVDNTLVRTNVAVDQIAGATTITAFDTSRFPTGGYPYTIRIGEGTPRLQNITVTNNNTSTGVLTLGSGMIQPAYVGDRIGFVTGGTLSAPVAPSSFARTINLGTQVQAPATVNEGARLFATTEPAFILQGNYLSNEVTIRALTSGTAGNVSAGRVNQFVSASPFSGAAFISTSKCSGGLDRETDTEFRARALAQLQSLSRGTPLAIKNAAIGVTDKTSQSRVVSSNIVEDFGDHEVILYVDDGTGDVATVKNLPEDTSSAIIAPGDLSVIPVDATDWPNAGWILVEAEGLNPTELLQYGSKTAGSLGLLNPVVSTHASGAIIDFVDLVSESAEATQRHFQLSNFPIVRNSERIWSKTPLGLWTLLTRDVDYILNKGTGEFQLTFLGGVPAGTKVVASYSYYTNLIAEVQKVVEGDPDDPTNYPGVKAAGIFVSVEQPIIKRITVVAAITAASGYSASTIAPLVKSAIESYIASLKIGQDVVVAKLIEKAYSVTGLEDIHIVTPTSNVIVLESELPTPYEASGASLVSVL